MPTGADIPEICRLRHEEGFSVQKIAQIYGVSRQMIWAYLRQPERYAKSAGTSGLRGHTQEELQARRDEMRRLRFDEKLSLQMIADKFDVTRELVRQAIGNSGPDNGGFYYCKYMDTLHNQEWMDARRDKTNGEIAAEIGLPAERISRGNCHHPITDTNSHLSIGVKWESWASEILTNLGIQNELMPVRHPFDILLTNGKRIDVKVATVANHAPSYRMISPLYCFRVRAGKKREDTDFYLLIIAETKDVFIIPVDKVSPRRDQIRFCWPTLRPTLAKWQHYHNRFDLLMEK